MGAMSEQAILFQIYKFLIPIFLAVMSMGFLFLLNYLKKIADNISEIKVSLAGHSEKVEHIEASIKRHSEKLDNHADMIYELKGRLS